MDACTCHLAKMSKPIPTSIDNKSSKNNAHMSRLQNWGVFFQKKLLPLVQVMVYHPNISKLFLLSKEVIRMGSEQEVKDKPDLVRLEFKVLHWQIFSPHPDLLHHSDCQSLSYILDTYLIRHHSISQSPLPRSHPSCIISNTWQVSHKYHDGA